MTKTLKDIQSHIQSHVGKVNLPQLTQIQHDLLGVPLIIEELTEAVATFPSARQQWPTSGSVQKAYGCPSF